MAERSELVDLRRKIDEIDRQILSLLDRRMALVLQVGKVKKELATEIYDPEREAEIMRALLKQPLCSLSPLEIEELYSAIFRISRWRQGEKTEVGCLLCISILESDAEMVRQKMAVAAKEADIMELRLDALAEIRLSELLPFTERPLIVTNRRREEGGFFRGQEQKRFYYLEEAVKYGVTYVDVEWMSSEPLRSRLLGKRGETHFILSYHDFQKTPPLEKLLSLWKEMIKIEADVYKIVTWAQNLDDSLTILRFLRKVRGDGKKVISHCMGDKGRISRILAPLFGSFMAFCSLEGAKWTAPGQMRVGQMRRVWEVLEG
ncbi:MAG: type I 3-dehydroquinate dehydratase [Deltaproteobacteria bacterium]|nr:MAG: type I 3-dehydroquinate dehydratase [Deltaproteobacteria bacterium]